MTIGSYYQDVKSINIIPLSQMLRLQASGGKLSVAMTDFSVRSHYKHLTVTPTPPNGAGYSSTRLRVLDTLIDALMKDKKIPEKELPILPIDVSNMDSRGINKLTEKYAQVYRVGNLADQKGIHFGISDSHTALFLDFKV